jgi:hypothetical protein
VLVIFGQGRKDMNVANQAAARYKRNIASLCRELKEPGDGWWASHRCCPCTRWLLIPVDIHSASTSVQITLLSGVKCIYYLTSWWTLCVDEHLYV